MKITKYLILLLLIIIPTKSHALIEVDITRGNLNPLPIAVSPLSHDKKINSDIEKELKLEDHLISKVYYRWHRTYLKSL